MKFVCPCYMDLSPFHDAGSDSDFSILLNSFTLVLVILIII